MPDSCTLIDVHHTLGAGEVFETTTSSQVITTHVEDSTNDFVYLDEKQLIHSSTVSDSETIVTTAAPSIQIYQFDDALVHQLVTSRPDTTLTLTDHDPNHDLNQSEQMILIVNEDTIENNNIEMVETSPNDTELEVELVQKSPSTAVAVPSLSNVEEIFQLLSQKIAKYCQVLADLTNCEVFYKAQMPVNVNGSSESASRASGKKPSKYKPKTVRNKHMRSLYWGTHQMLFQFSHDQGIKYDRANGDSLIKINQRSLSSDVNNLIEEILNEPALNLQNELYLNAKTNVTTTSTKEAGLVEEQEAMSLVNERKRKIKQVDGDIQLKDCCVYLDRMDENLVEDYLNRFEMKHSTNNELQLHNNDEFDLPKEQEAVEDDEDVVYSDDVAFNINAKVGKMKTKSKAAASQQQQTQGMNENGCDEDDDDEEDNDEDDIDERLLLEKNFFNFNDTDPNEDDYYSCELCSNHTYKHLTQLKLHQMRVHEDVEISDTTPYVCRKCESSSFDDRTQYMKHLLSCYHPDLYTCKTCNQTYASYTNYLFHVRYIHAQVLYMCSICNRKYRNLNDLLDHDQLVHSKNVNYCEICFEQHKSRKHLYDHYIENHLVEMDLTQQQRAQHQQQLKTTEDTEVPKKQRKCSSEEDEQLIEQLLTTPNEVTTCSSEVTQPSLDDSTTIPNDNSTSTNVDDSTSELHNYKNDLIRGLIDRKHQCKWCSLRFYTKRQLKQHETTHVNSVLNCPVCDKEFSHKDRLTGHMKCHMEPSLECKVCGKKFKRLCNLYNHELVHGLTEHAFMLCQFCGRGFRSRRDYQNHVIANHRNQIMKSDQDKQSPSTTDDSRLGTSLDDSTRDGTTKRTSRRNQHSRGKHSTGESSTSSVVDLLDQPTEDKAVDKTTSPTTTTTITLIEDNHLPADAFDADDTYFTRTETVQLTPHDLLHMEQENEQQDDDNDDEEEEINEAHHHHHFIFNS